MYEVGNGGASAAGIVMVLTFMVAGRHGDENTDGEGMAGLVQPVYMDNLANRSQAQPVLCNNSAL